ncbi:putative FMN/FAD exporter YeeO [Streptomyces hundungensis]|uniref:Probable multidrug resistance protein NorM n=1 Tax=Streptomyces hundungensis TaxID=1077946 RepID=A0A387HR94_9ACTN|nr:MATE family efflux transporter [Streptomyces hundungensis]AYG83397.1 putative FMN/FAD exporter YeeO [Streptomyces hundungensis]
MEATAHRRRLVSLAFPVYGELMAGVAAGIINTLWVTRLGGDAVAAVAVATNVENVLLGIALMAGSGTTVLLARARGAGEQGAVRAAVRGGWALWALLAPAVAIGAFLGREPIARLVLGADAGGALPLAVGYFSIALPGIAVFFATNVVDGILKGTGDTRTPMRLALLSNGLILVLDPLLILGCGLGVRGAALATVAGRSVALARGLLVLRRTPALRAAGPVPHAWTTDLRRTVRTGLPLSADFVTRMGGALAVVAVVARIGVAEVAAYGIATKAMYGATMAFYSVRQAAAIHTARLLGAGRDERGAVGREVLRVAAVLGAGAGLVLFAAAPWIMAAFGAHGAVATAGVLQLRCLGPYLMLLACFIGWGGVVEGGGGSPRLVRITGCGVALQLVLAHALSGLGLPGICLAMALAMGVQCAALARLHRRTGAQRVVDGSPARAG